MRICEWNQQAWGWTGKEENPYGFQTPQSPQKKLSPDERYPRLETLSSWSEVCKEFNAIAAHSSHIVLA